MGDDWCRVEDRSSCVSERAHTVPEVPDWPEASVLPWISTCMYAGNAFDGSGVLGVRMRMVTMRTAIKRLGRRQDGQEAKCCEIICPPRRRCELLGHD